MDKAEVIASLRRIEHAAYEIEKLLKGGYDNMAIEDRRDDVRMSYFTATNIAEQLSTIERISTQMQRELKDG